MTPYRYGDAPIEIAPFPLMTPCGEGRLHHLCRGPGWWARWRAGVRYGQCWRCDECHTWWWWTGGEWALRPVP